MVNVLISFQTNSIAPTPASAKTYECSRIQIPFHPIIAWRELSEETTNLLTGSLEEIDR